MTQLLITLAFGAAAAVAAFVVPTLLGYVVVSLLDWCFGKSKTSTFEAWALGCLVLIMMGLMWFMGVAIRAITGL